MCCSEGLMQKAGKSRVFLISVLMGALVVVGIVNFVLAKVLFVSFKSMDPTHTGNATSVAAAAASADWMITASPTTLSPSNSSGNGSRFSFFVNQGINFFYLIVGGVMVYVPRRHSTNCLIGPRTRFDCPPTNRYLHTQTRKISTIDTHGCCVECLLLTGGGDGGGGGMSSVGTHACAARTRSRRRCAKCTTRHT